MLALGVKKFKIGELEVEFHESVFKEKKAPLIPLEASKDLIDSANTRAKAKKLLKDQKSDKMNARVIDDKLLFHSSKS